MADPEEKALALIKSKPEGVLQSELWKELNVDSRKCSRIVKQLEDDGLIDRIESKKGSTKTYLLRAKVTAAPVNPSNLLAGDELIPCIGCELECIVEECHPLMDWMYQLAIVQHGTKEPKGTQRGGDEMKTKQPAGKEPKEKQPAGKKTKDKRDSAHEPKAKQPAGKEPKAKQRGVTEQKAKQRGTKEPRAKKRKT
jgi:hypothetical protein